MAETGILSNDSRVELIEGEVIDMAPIGSTDTSYINRLARELIPAVTDTALVSVQNPIILGDLSEPEPDFALLKPKSYQQSFPLSCYLKLQLEV